MSPGLRTGQVNRLPQLQKIPDATITVSQGICRPESDIEVCFSIEGKGKKSDYIGLYVSPHFGPEVTCDF